MKEHETNYKQGLINATGQFPLTPNTQINLPTLCIKLQNTKWLKATNGHPAYIQTSFIIDNTKNSFKIFKNGKLTCCHSVSPKAWHFFLDFFYYTFVINCLEDYA